MSEKNNVTPLIIERVFNAPVDLVFDTWTDTSHLCHWMGPKGVKTTYKSANIVVNGIAHYCVEFPDGMKMWGKVKYHEIKKPNRLVYSQFFSDENGGVGKHPMSDSWPAEMLTTIEFESLGNKTKIKLTWIPVNGTPEEIKTFTEAMSGMHQGWGGAFENLDTYLLKLI